MIGVVLRSVWNLVILTVVDRLFEHAFLAFFFFFSCQTAQLEF